MSEPMHLGAVRVGTYEASYATVRATLIGVAIVMGLVLFFEAGRTDADRTWMLAAGVAVLFVARGIHLCRPVTLSHLGWAAMCVVLSKVAYMTGHSSPGFVIFAASGFVLMLPFNSAPEPDQRGRIAALIQGTVGDPLSPFSLHTAKSYFFNSAGTAALGYRARAGIAVVAADPVGSANDYPALIDEFSRFATNNGWRIAVLGAGERCQDLWATSGDERKALRAVPIGRDVVVGVGGFTLEGKKFRNLRQAVRRSHNAGVTTEIVREDALDQQTHTALMDIVRESRAGHQNRGFSMILDHLLDGTHPGMLVIIARDHTGQAVGFQRYGTANYGRELSLDVPWRSKNAPNGTDERMTVDMISHAQSCDAQLVSLSFAAFPELFDTSNPSAIAKTFRTLIHVGDSVISLESLYRYLRKFRAMGERRYVMLRFRDLLPALLALLTLEFVPHRTRD